MLAGVIAILARDGGPKAIAGLMKQKDGRVVVRLYDTGGSPRYVSVEKTFRKNSEKHNGGAIWATGAIANFVASDAHLVGPAVSYSIGQGATMVSACWGVFVWREFAGAPKAARLLLLFMFIFFLAGLSAVALAPLY